MTRRTMRRRTFVSGTIGVAISAPLALRTRGGLAQEATPVGSPAASPAAAAPPLPPGAELVASGLNNPRGLAFGPDGALYVAESGAGGTEYCVQGPEGDEICYGTTGSVARLLNGGVERVIEGIGSSANKGTGMNATGPHDVAFAGDDLYVIVGLGADPTVRAGLGAIGNDLGHLFRVANGSRTSIADVAGYEASDPNRDKVDSNPYALVALPDGGFAVADAGGNDLLKVVADGTISTLALFPAEQAKAPDGSEIPMQAVPNSVAIGPDGDFYVGQLTGFPFPPGAAKVYRVPAAGGTPEAFADGFTNTIDVAFDPAGNLYVLEFNRGGLANINPNDPATLEGQVTRIGRDGAREVLAGPGLIAPTAIAIGPDGMLYLSVFGVMAGAGAVIRLPLAAGATPVAATPAA